MENKVKKTKSDQSEQQIFESMYLGDYWELRVHNVIETADTCGPAASINHVLRKFIVELYHNLLVGVPAEIWRKIEVPSKISIS